MLVFVALGIVGLMLLVGSLLFGHDHDGDIGHEFDHDHGGDHGGHEAGGNEPTVSIFSVKVVGAFLMSFGAAGFIGRTNDVNMTISSLIGLASGVGVGGLMYGAMRLLYGQQSNSVQSVTTAIGQEGQVTTTIAACSIGEVAVSVNDQRMSCTAQAEGREMIPLGARVLVVGVVGSTLIVKKVQ